MNRIVNTSSMTMISISPPPSNEIAMAVFNTNLSWAIYEFLSTHEKIAFMNTSKSVYDFIPLQHRVVKTIMTMKDITSSLPYLNWCRTELKYP